MSTTDLQERLDVVKSSCEQLQREKEAAMAAYNALADEAAALRGRVDMETVLRRSYQTALHKEYCRWSRFRWAIVGFGLGIASVIIISFILGI